MKTTIYFSNRQKDEKITPEIKSIIKKAVKQTLIHENIRADSEVSISFVGENEIKELNSFYRKKDSVTDVLSFPILEEETYEDEPEILGDVVICVKKAAAQANEYGHSLIRELAFLTVHSVLHLLGYDHETSKEDEKVMFALQDEIMAKLAEEKNQVL